MHLLPGIAILRRAPATASSNIGRFRAFNGVLGTRAKAHGKALLAPLPVLDRTQLKLEFRSSSFVVESRQYGCARNSRRKK